MAAKRLKTPYLGLVPRLSSDEKEALRADIRKNGVLCPIFTDTENNILDGHTRYEIDPRAPVQVVPGAESMIDAEKKAFVVRTATNRRHLSQEQRRELGKTQKEIAAELYVVTIDGEPRWSQVEIGAMLGVSQDTVSLWLKNISDTKARNAYIPAQGNDSDAPSTEPASVATPKPKRKKKNVKLDDEDKAEIARMANEGATQEEIAAEFKISQPRVAQVLKEAAKRETEREAEQDAAEDADESGIWKVTAEQAVVPCDALITDPPYGILDEPWEPDRLESFTREWACHWASCGADLAAIFWSQRYLFEGRRWFDESLRGYRFQQLLVWHYPNNKSPQSRMGLKQTWEPVFLYRKAGSEKQILVPGKDWGDDLTDFDCHVGAVPQSNFNDADRKQHPAQKPVSVMRWLVGCLTRRADLVADPFCGSGTTGIASVQLGRRFHGIETDPKFRKMAEGRIAAYGGN